jgi:hypothetical protein
LRTDFFNESITIGLIILNLKSYLILGCIPRQYVTKEDLNTIFDQKNDENINFSEDYYLPIGTSPSFADYQIKINPDKFFGKHAAILGNTGSGKSCTVASIIQSVFNHNYNGATLKSSHFIIFDTNGEYKNAFIGYKEVTEQGEKEVIYKNKENVNPIYIDQSGLQVPYWFMNYDDFDYLFQPSALTQAPVFKTSIGLAKEGKLKSSSNHMPKSYEKFISNLIECGDFFMQKNHKPSTVWVFNPNNEIIAFSEEIESKYNNIKQLVRIIGETREKVVELKSQESLRNEFQLYLASKEEIKINSSNSIDMPKFFNFSDLISTYIDNSIEESEGSSQKLRENIATLKLRLHAHLTDERISNPLMLKQKEDIEGALSKFLAFILGDLCKIISSSDSGLFVEYYNSQLAKENNEKLSPDKVSQITIIDLSLLPYEVLETITGLVGRLVLDFVTRLDQNRGKLPIVMVLEEAQNYIPEKDKGDKPAISKKVFERIAREGRKFGISLLVSSQRPW